MSALQDSVVFQNLANILNKGRVGKKELERVPGLIATLSPISRNSASCVQYLVEYIIRGGNTAPLGLNNAQLAAVETALDAVQNLDHRLSSGLGRNFRRNLEDHGYDIWFADKLKTLDPLIRDHPCFQTLIQEWLIRNPAWNRDHLGLTVTGVRQWNPQVAGFPSRKIPFYSQPANELPAQPVQSQPQTQTPYVVGSNWYNSAHASASSTSVRGLNNPYRRRSRSGTPVYYQGSRPSTPVNAYTNQGYGQGGNVNYSQDRRGSSSRPQTPVLNPSSTHFSGILGRQPGLDQARALELPRPNTYYEPVYSNQFNQGTTQAPYPGTQPPQGAMQVPQGQYYQGGQSQQMQYNQVGTPQAPQQYNQYPRQGRHYSQGLLQDPGAPYGRDANGNAFGRPAG